VRAGISTRSGEVEWRGPNCDDAFDSHRETISTRANADLFRNRRWGVDPKRNARACAAHAGRNNADDDGAFRAPRVGCGRIVRQFSSCAVDPELEPERHPCDAQSKSARAERGEI